jgi:hypothetical protein
MDVKKLIATVLACIVAFSSLAITSFAGNETSKYVKEEFVLDYVLVQTASNSLTISGTTATCSSIVIGNSTVISVSATQTLEKQGFLWSWSDVSGATWSKTVSGKKLTLEKDKSGLSNGTYRVRTVFTLTSNNGSTETITTYSNEVTI